MTELTVALIALAVSGLGFVTYNHPDYARKILMPLWIAAIGGFLILSVLYVMQINSSYKFEAIVDSNFGDYYKEFPQFDSNNRFQDSIKTSEFFKSHKRLREISSGIQSDISKLQNDKKVSYKKYSFYLGYLAFVVIVLFVLSFLFEDMHNKKNKNVNNKPI